MNQKERRRKIPSALMGAVRRRRKVCIIIGPPGAEGGKKEVQTKWQESQVKSSQVKSSQVQSRQVMSSDQEGVTRPDSNTLCA